MKVKNKYKFCIYVRFSHIMECVTWKSKHKHLERNPPLWKINLWLRYDLTVEWTLAKGKLEQA